MEKRKSRKKNENIGYISLFSYPKQINIIDTKKNSDETWRMKDYLMNGLVRDSIRIESTFIRVLFIISATVALRMSKHDSISIR